MDQEATVTIGGSTITLTKPPALFAISAAYLEGKNRVGNLYANGAACLFMCYPVNKKWFYHPVPTRWNSQLDVAQYGEAIFNELANWAQQNDITISEITTACLEAYKFASASMLTKSEVEAAKKKLSEIQSSEMQ